MYALSFDMNIADLKENYGDIYNNAYYEVRKLLIRDGFEWIQGSTYLTRSENLTNLMQAIMHLSKIDRFRKSVRDIRGYRVEEWSDFTEIVKKGQTSPHRKPNQHHNTVYAPPRSNYSAIAI